MVTKAMVTKAMFTEAIVTEAMVTKAMFTEAMVTKAMVTEAMVTEAMASVTMASVVYVLSGGSMRMRAGSSLHCPVAKSNTYMMSDTYSPIRPPAVEKVYVYVSTASSARQDLQHSNST
eukprot:g60021.t1